MSARQQALRVEIGSVLIPALRLHVVDGTEPKTLRYAGMEIASRLPDILWCALVPLGESDEAAIVQCYDDDEGWSLARCSDRVRAAQWWDRTIGTSLGEPLPVREAREVETPQEALAILVRWCS